MPFEARSEAELLAGYHEAIRSRLLRRLGDARGPVPKDPIAFAAQEAPPLPGIAEHDRLVAMRRLIESACTAFVYGDLLRAALELMGGAEGSFGLVLSHSLDAERDVVIASRGQTMSVAFYPALGCITFGSEAAATKACMGMGNGQKPSAATAANGPPLAGRVAPAPQEPEQPSFRFDLDDVAGEVVLLRWDATTSPLASTASGSLEVPACGEASDASTDGSSQAAHPGARHMICCAGTEREAVEVLSSSSFPAVSEVAASRTLLCVNIQQHGDQMPMWHRRLQLDGNPLLSPPPDMLSSDPVGRDLLDTPALLQKITLDFDKASTDGGKDTEAGGHSFNRISAWTFTSKLRQRLKMHRACTHDGSVDLLITGCEVSLWTGEQFASDLQLLYPKLKIEVISSNKLLGQLGQTQPIPQPGFRFNEATHDLNQSLVLLLSHSGGTYAPLACCSLLSGYTSNIFVVTSELDTQAARAVRSITAGDSRDRDADKTARKHPFLDLSSQHVFSTHAGFRPAESCSLSVVAMHHLLSMLLIFLMGFLAHFEHGGHGTSGETHSSICGSAFNFNEVRELAMIARQQHVAATEIVGHKALGDTTTAAALRKQGFRWGQHVLEGPLSWLFCLGYIALTVLLGLTPLSAICSAAVGQPLPVPQLIPSVEASAAVPAWLWAVRYLVAVADVLLYAFLGWWTTVLIRLMQVRAMRCAQPQPRPLPRPICLCLALSLALSLGSCLASNTASAWYPPGATLGWASALASAHNLCHGLILSLSALMLPCAALLQGRPWLHRVAGRSVLIGDVPWVSQCAEAFASKLFALSYSISSCSFASANPADHLVHRHTHRVVRGSLLVVGRPDGRLNALTTAEAACTLAVNQVSYA